MTGFSKPGSFFIYDGHKFVAQELDKGYLAGRDRQKWIADDISVWIAEYAKGPAGYGTDVWAAATSTQSFLSRDRAARHAIKCHNSAMEKARELVARYGT